MGVSTVVTWAVVVMTWQVRNQLGAFVVPDYLHWASSLPKTMSGKIIRRMLRKIAKHGKDVKMEVRGR